MKYTQITASLLLMSLNFTSHDITLMCMVLTLSSFFHGNVCLVARITFCCVLVNTSPDDPASHVVSSHAAASHAVAPQAVASHAVASHAVASHAVLTIVLVLITLS